MEKNPNDLFLSLRWPAALAESRNYPEARARLQEIVKRDHSSWKLTSRWPMSPSGTSYAGDHPTVVKALWRSIRKYFARACCAAAPCFSQGNLDQAEAVLKNLSRQVPDSVDVRLKLAYVSMGRRNYAEAEAAFNKILEAHPTEWRALAGLVDNDLAQNRPEQGILPAWKRN